MEELKEDHLSGIDLEVDNETRDELHTASKWGRFIGIFMFVICGILLIAVATGGNAFAQILQAAFYNLGFVFAVDTALLVVTMFAAILFFAVSYYFLYNFSVKIKQALHEESTGHLNQGINSLKLFFILSGVVSIIGVLFSLYSLSIYL